MVAQTATATLDPSTRVTFFRSLGRVYLRVGLPALIVALATGAVVARNLDWDGLLIATVAVAGALMASLAVAVVQARRMTGLRRTLLESPDDRQLSEQVRRGGRFAGGLRAGIGLLNVALVVMGAFLAT